MIVYYNSMHLLGGFKIDFVILNQAGHITE